MEAYFYVLCKVICSMHACRCVCRNGSLPCFAYTCLMRFMKWDAIFSEAETQMSMPFMTNMLQMMLLGGVTKHYYTLSCQCIRNTHTVPVIFSSFIRYICNIVELWKPATGTMMQVRMCETLICARAVVVYLPTLPN